jgi:hypothetical protein
VNCNGGHDGSVTVNVSGGTGPYSVTVNGVTHTGVTTSTTFTGLATGTYPATITDAHNCPGSATGVLVDQPTPIVASETTVPVSCNGGNDGKVTVNVSGGTGPYSVTVNGVTHTGVTTSTCFTGLPTGTYPATITDAHGCPGSATGVLVDQPTPIVASETTVPASCNGGNDGKVTVNVSGGTGPYSVTVNGVTHTAVTTSTTFTGLSTGTYPATITDAHNCPGSATGVLVDQPTPIVASETTVPVSCNGGSNGKVCVNVSGGTGPYSVTVNGVTHTAVTTSTTFTGLATGTYPATITDAHNCPGSATGVLVDQPTPIVASETTVPVGCNGGSDGKVTVNVSGGTGPYSVTVNGVTHTAVTTSTTFTGLPTGTYPATITDAHSCPGSATGVLVSQPDPLMCTVSGKSEVVSSSTGDTLTASVTGGTGTPSYSWSVNNPDWAISPIASASTATVSFTAPNKVSTATFTVTIKDANGCMTTCSETVSASAPTLITDTMRCTLLNNCGTSANSFKLILTQDPQNMPCYRVTASNPGQFYYNVFFTGTPGASVTVSVTLPYPFVTQGANPIEVYDGYTATTGGGQTCLVPGVKTFAGSTQVTLASYGGKSSCVTNLTFNVPPSGSVYLAIHMDYGLKKTTGYSPDASGNAVSCTNTTQILIPSAASYVFSTGGAGTGSATVTSCIDFKKTPGTAGIVIHGNSLNPAPGGTAVLKDSNKNVLGTCVTDSDGWYMINYKWTGKAATFTVTLTPPNNGTPQTQTITLKSNGFIEADFTVP